MISEKLLKRVARKVIADCITELDMIQSTSSIISSLSTSSDSFENLSLLKTKITRAMNSRNRGTISDENYEVRITQIHKSLLTQIKSINVNEILVPFDYDDKEGIFYLIHDSQSCHIYDYLGPLKNNTPHGQGIAKYFDGTFYEGQFKAGIREGKGKLKNKENVVIKEGNWKNDKCYEKDIIEYYPDIKVAANAIHEVSALNDLEVEKIIIPNLNSIGLLAFPIEGDSMEPSLSEGDIIICKELQSLENIKDNESYVVFHKGSIWVKIIQKSSNIKIDNTLTLISENHLYNRPFTIKVNKTTKFFKLVSQVKYF